MFPVYDFDVESLSWFTERQKTVQTNTKNERHNVSYVLQWSFSESSTIVGMSYPSISLETMSSRLSDSTLQWVPALSHHIVIHVHEEKSNSSTESNFQCLSHPNGINHLGYIKQCSCIMWDSIFLIYLLVHVELSLMICIEVCCDFPASFPCRSLHVKVGTLQCWQSSVSRVRPFVRLHHREFNRLTLENSSVVPVRYRHREQDHQCHLIVPACAFDMSSTILRKNWEVCHVGVTLEKSVGCSDDISIKVVCILFSNW